MQFQVICDIICVLEYLFKGPNMAATYFCTVSNFEAYKFVLQNVTNKLEKFERY